MFNQKDYMKAYNQKHREEAKNYSKAYYQSHKDEVKVYRQTRKKEDEAYRQNYKNKYKEKVFSHYGKFCACCGENEIDFLTIDHINGDGNKHRKELGNKGGLSFYKWLVENNFPKEFQTLCMNCNWAKSRLSNKGICPHQRKLKLLLQKKS